MDYWKARLTHAVCFRNKRGFGVHSPFMFNLIMNVIRDREHRYVCPVELRRQLGLGEKEFKVYCLLSRLISFLRVRRVACIGWRSVGLMTYLSLLFEKVQVSASPSALDEADFIYIGGGTPAEILERILPFAPDTYPRYLVLADIHKDADNACLWRRLRKQATVSVDMMWYGLLFFDHKIQKGTYKLMI